MKLMRAWALAAAVTLLLPLLAAPAAALGTDKTEWYYAQLSAGEKEMYTALLAAAEKRETQVTFPAAQEPGEATLRRLFNALSYEQPGDFWLNGWGVTTQAAAPSSSGASLSSGAASGGNASSSGGASSGSTASGDASSGTVASGASSGSEGAASQGAGDGAGFTVTAYPNVSSLYGAPSAGGKVGPSTLNLQAIEAAQQAAQKAGAAAVASAAGTDYEKVKAFNAWLVAHNEYDEQAAAVPESQADTYADAFTYIGALTKGKAVCQGYALAFKYLCDQAGIPCVFVPGTGLAPGGTQYISHAWNYVQLEGAWYLVDSTWNDPIVVGGAAPPPGQETQYLLRGADSVVGGKPISESYRPDTSQFTLPPLSKTDYQPGAAPAAASPAASSSSVDSSAAGSSSASSSEGASSNESASEAASGGEADPLAASVRGAVQAAVTRAQRRGALDATAVVGVPVGPLAPETLAAAAAAAKEAAGEADVVCHTLLCADTVAGGQLLGRLYVDTADAARIKNAIETGVRPAGPALLGKLQGAFRNRIAVAVFSQQGSFGAVVRAQVALDLSGMDTRSLYFYTYDDRDGSYGALPNVSYTVDENGYLSFETGEGNCVIVSASPLRRR